MLRIEKQTDAAEMLRITTRRLREMESLPAPWWTPDLRTEDGYDVCGILIAQYTKAGGTNNEQLKRRREIADTEKLELQREAEELKVWELERQKQTNLGRILPADVYQEFVRELLGMIRGRLTEIPYRLSKRASAAVKQLIYVPESQIKKQADASPLQREIQKLLDDVQKWLDGGPE